VARFADYFTRYRPFHDGTLPRRLGLPQRVDLGPEHPRQIAARLRRVADQNAEGRVRRIQRLANEILIPFDDRYARIGRRLLDRAESLVAECVSSYLLHADLLETWPELVARAKNVDLLDLYRRQE
jgi:hypothetical protein